VQNGIAQNSYEKKAGLQEGKRLWFLCPLKYTFLALKSYIVFVQVMLLATVGV